MQLNLRRVLIALVALVAIGGIWSALFAGSDQSKTDAGVDSISGTIVIDYGKSSGKPVETFDFDLPLGSSSWDIFKSEGIQVQGTQDYPTGFVCRLNDWPSKDDQDCADVPTYSEGSWAYYVTNPEFGDGWFMSGVGAATHTPVCGGYEAWVWIAPGQSASSTLPNFEPTTRGCS
jgi:hypothetical protein